jgi:hypothetical protein
VPLAVFIEVFVAGDIVRNILPAAATVFAFVARQAPSREIIIVPNFTYIVRKLIDAGKISLLSFPQAIRIAAARDLRIAVKNYGSRLIAIFIHVQAILARLIHVERQVGRVHFERLAVTQVTYAEKYRTD